MGSIQKSIKVPSLGDFNIYVDKSDQARAERLIHSMPKIMIEGYEKGTEQFGKKLLKLIKYSIKNGIPPKGVSWQPHSPNTKKTLGEHPLFVWTGQYLRSVGVYKTKRRVFVGLPPYVKKLRKSGRSKLSLNRVATLLEYGNIKGTLPPRPLWGPSYRAAGGNKELIKEIRRALQKEVRRYV